MNWTMGRYIDSLDEEGRDRLVTAADFSDGCWWDGSCGCLVGTALGWGHADDVSKACVTRLHDEAYMNSRGGRWQGTPPAYRYPEAIERFGKARVVRAIKLRAGAKVSLPLPESAREASGVVHG